MSKRQDFINLAVSYLGTRESDAKFREIIDTYNSITPLPVGYKVKYTDDWCAAYVSAVAKKLNMTDIVFPECGCERMIKLYQAAGRWRENDDFVPQPGDIVFYDWQDTGKGDNMGFSDHVGIVTQRTGRMLKVIEGNVNQDVRYRDLEVDGRFIRGYGLPDFEGKETVVENSAGTVTEIPVKAKYFGIDLSGWQKSLTDGQVLKRGGVDFVILKVTEGTGYINEAFDAHYNMCKKLGIPVGAYVYSHAIGANQGKAEAEYALKALAGRKLELPVYLDIEDHEMLAAGKVSIMAATRAFGAAVRAAGYKVGVYASLSRYGSYIDADALRSEGYSIWCAAYNNSGPGMTCDIWQHTSSGQLAGYNGKLDFNIMYNAALMTGAAQVPEAPKETESAETAKEVEVMVKLRQLAKGSNGAQVESMQVLLIDKFGISCGPDGADSKFGTNTDKAVRAFQKKKGLVVDGICGANTWTALLAG